MMDPIKVLLALDSMLFCEMLTHSLKNSLPLGSRIEKARDPFEARDKILSFDPDVMVLDAELPNMNGIEFLRRLLTQYSQPTIVLSKRASYRPLALDAGAVDFLVKPGMILTGHKFFEDLANRIKAAVGKFPELKKRSKAQPPKPATERLRVKPQAPMSAPPPMLPQHIELIAIGSSTGGTEALSTILKSLRPTLPPIVIVQHIPPMFSRLFAERLNNDCALSIKEAADGDRLRINCVYIAPGDKQMRVNRMRGLISLECKREPRYNGHCPSVDVLFNSVALSFGKDALGVILTGMGADGAKGLLKMRQAGSPTLGQDEATCVVYGMPKAAWDIGAVERQLPITSIARAITTIAGRS